MRLSTALATFALASACVSAPAFAQDKPAANSTARHAAPSPEKMAEARARFERGLAMFEEKNFEGARVELERAYEIAPTWKLLYNIGLCYAQRGDYVEAVVDLERYLREGSDQIDNARRDDVNHELQNLRPRIAYVTVKSNIPDADLSLDDQALGKVSSTPVMVNPGRRKFSASKTGYFTATTVVTPASSDKVEVNLELKELPKAGKSTDIAPIISWSVTGALAVGATVTGVLSSGAQSDLGDERNNPRATAASLDDASSQVKTTALITDILIAGAIVGVGVSTYLTWFRKKSDEPSTEMKIGVSPFGLKGTF